MSVKKSPKSSNQTEADTFEKMRDSILKFDPIYWIEKHLTIDNKPFDFSGAWKPFADIYRYIGIKSLEKDALPLVLLKSRQVGGTVMAAAIEMFLMDSFGVDRPPIRVMHAFPTKHIAEAFSKTKFTPMCESSVLTEDASSKIGVSPYMMTRLNKDSSIYFKNFEGGNHIWIESTGLTGERLRGKTIDAIFFDECFPYQQLIETSIGKVKIGKLYRMWKNNEKLPLVKTYNEDFGVFEMKEISHAWNRGKRDLLSIKLDGFSIKCTPNHRFLTTLGWVKAKELTAESLILAPPIKDGQIEPLIVRVHSVKPIKKQSVVYDLEIKGNHNFITTSKNGIGVVAHNCQDMTAAALSNSTKMLNQAQWGPVSSGIQVYFGTPKRKGSDFNKIWNQSSQQFYYLGCEKCKQYFPLYTYGTDDWERIWIKEFVVQCTKCGHQQDKRDAAGRGKWIASNTSDDPSKIKFIGFHINMMYMPHITREKMMGEKPENSPINTDRAYHNESKGEFYEGDSSPITVQEIRDNCGVPERYMLKSITPEEKLVIMGIDYGQMSDLERKIDPIKFQGESLTTAVILTEEAPNQFMLAFACKFDQNDPTFKKNLIRKLMRTYSVNLCVGDIGYSNDISWDLHNEFGDRYITSRASGKITDNVKFLETASPPEIRFDKNFYYEELIKQLKMGNIKFPLGNYDSLYWLMEHCSNLEQKPVLMNGIATQKYVKSGLTDGFAALLNAYLAYKYLATSAFTEMNPLFQRKNAVKENRPLIISSYLPMR